MSNTSIENQIEFTIKELQLLQANQTAARSIILANEIKKAVAVKRAVLSTLVRSAEARGSPPPQYDKKVNYFKYIKGGQL
jgi:hypothetical protein